VTKLTLRRIARAMLADCLCPPPAHKAWLRRIRRSTKRGLGRVIGELDAMRLKWE